VAQPLELHGDLEAGAGVHGEGGGAIGKGGGF
jgi:hypothetical protein